jgi:hypothetical protein
MLFVTLLIIIIILLVIRYISSNELEPFADPYSLYLHDMISEKELKSNLDHSLKLYYSRDMVPMYEME